MFLFGKRLTAPDQVYNTESMTEAPNFHHAADLQRVAVYFRAEKNLSERIGSLYNDLARHALQTNGVSFRLYPDVVTRLNRGVGVVQDQVDGSDVSLHRIEELKYDLAVSAPERGDIDVSSLSVDFLRRQDDPKDFKAIILAEPVEAYRKKLDKIITKFSGNRLPPALSKLSRTALFWVIDSNDLAPDVATESSLQNRVRHDSNNLGNIKHRRGDSFAAPTVSTVRFMSFDSLGLKFVGPNP
jgi:hypothetical protein